MGGLIRIVVFLLIAYLVIRRLVSWWNSGQPRGNSRRREMPPPFVDRDVMDAKFTEIPTEEKSTAENGEK